MNHLLKLLDLSKEEILGILNLADQLSGRPGPGRDGRNPSVR